MNNLVKKTLEIIGKSWRTMPAHFCRDDSRSQTYGIDYGPLTADIDRKFASQAWGAADMPLEDTAQTAGVIMIGEDLMYGSFVLATLGGKEYVAELKEAILGWQQNQMSESMPDILPVLDTKEVKTYFDYCVQYGLEGYEDSLVKS